MMCSQMCSGTTGDENRIGLGKRRPVQANRGVPTYEAREVGFPESTPR